MMRREGSKQTDDSLPTVRGLSDRRRVRAWQLAACTLVVTVVIAATVVGPAVGQTAVNPPPANKSSLPQQKAKPLLLSGDEIIYDTKNARVITRGSVEIHYNNYAISADQIVYDRVANTLTANGNVQIKEPNGNIVRADRFDATADFRDAFIQSLQAVSKDDTPISARRAVRRDSR